MFSFFRFRSFCATAASPWLQTPINSVRTPDHRDRSVAIARRLGGSLLAIAPLCGLWMAPAQAGNQNLRLGPRFAPNPIEIHGNAGGAVPVSQVVGASSTATGECVGFTNSQPDHTLVLDSYFESLSLRVTSAEDTAIAIKGPGGIWCNDDDQGKNPGIAGQWLKGNYQIWVTTYGQNRNPGYTIRITENR